MQMKFVASPAWAQAIRDGRCSSPGPAWWFAPGDSTWRQVAKQAAGAECSDDTSVVAEQGVGCFGMPVATAC